jgi:hypothetical protein
MDSACSSFSPLTPAEITESAEPIVPLDDWTPMLPVPVDAPRSLPPHGLGRPSGKWVYRDAAGRRLFLACRFDTSEGKKDFFPLTYCEGPGGRREWRWKGVVAPRPLYGLDRLAARPNASVLIVEGEKSADAAQAIFPDYVAITSPNGADSADDADWSPLSARKVVIWPDADAKGRRYADEVAVLARRAAAVSVRIVQVPDTFRTKWDLADSIPAGTTVADLHRMLADAIPAGEETGGGPAPDRSIITERRRPAPALLLEIFGEWRPWIEATAESTASPPDYVACALIATAASLIGNARRVTPWPDWSEPSALWVGLVGKPSSGKSPAIAPLIEKLRRMEDELAVDYEVTLRRWQTEKQAAKCRQEDWEVDLERAVNEGRDVPAMPVAAVEPEKPARPRLMVADTTKEAVCDVLAGQPRGVLASRDELAGWLGSFDRYGGSGERAFWLEAFGGRPYVVDRAKFERPLRIPHLTVSVLGGIQPDKLDSTLMSGDDDGLPSRFLFTWPEPISPRRPTRVADHTAAVAGLRRLLSLDMGCDASNNPVPVELPLSPAAVDLFEGWRQKHFAETDSATGMLAGHFGKYPGLLLRIALVLEHLWWSLSAGAAPTEISTDSVAGAAALLDDYFRPMAERAYGDAALPEADRLAATLGRWIMRERPETVNASDIRRRLRLPGLSEASKVQLALRTLEEADWLRPRPSRGGNTPGRQKSDYDVNPLLWEAERG